MSASICNLSASYSSILRLRNRVVRATFSAMPMGVSKYTYLNLFLPNPWQDPIDGIRHLNEVAHWNRLLHDAVYAQLLAGRLPIMLGGDHCLAIGSISAVARRCREQGRPLRVLWLDAHADFNTATLTPSGNTHGMPVACL